MSHTIEGGISLTLIWNDAANEWSVAPEELLVYLDWRFPPTVCSTDDDFDATAYAESERASRDRTRTSRRGTGPCPTDWST
jgi:hypothetical protein